MDQTTKFEVIIVHFIVIFFLFVEYSNFMHNEKKNGMYLQRFFYSMVF